MGQAISTCARISLQICWIRTSESADKDAEHDAFDYKSERACTGILDI